MGIQTPKQQILTLTEWKSALPLTEKLVGHILPLIHEWFLKLCMTPIAKRTLIKTVNMTFIQKWTPTQCKDCLKLWFTNLTGRWPYSSSRVTLPCTFTRSKWYCGREKKKKMTDEVRQENKLFKIYLFRSPFVFHSTHLFGRTYIMAAPIHYKKTKLCLVVFCLTGQDNVWHIFKELKKNSSAETALVIKACK